MKQLVNKAEKRCQAAFDRVDEIALFNTEKVLNALQKFEVASRHFAPTTGYGYDDVGRDTLEKLFVELFEAEAAIVRPQIASGTSRRTDRQPVPFGTPFAGIKNSGNKLTDTRSGFGSKAEAFRTGNHFFVCPPFKIDGFINNEVFQLFSHVGHSALSKPY